MSIDLSRVTGISDSRGVITEIKDSLGRVIWSAGGKPVVLTVEKKSFTSYAGETSYSSDCVLLDIYPKKSNSTVKVTYGGLTKTLSFSGSNAQQVFFGTFNGASDSVATPASGDLIIEGQYKNFACSVYQSGSKSTLTTYCSCITGVKDWGNTTAIASYAFYNCTKIALTSLPSIITDIGGFSFYGCTSLALTSLPNSVTSIGGSAFYGCTNLALTSLPNSVTRIGGSAFYGCTNLALTSLPDSITSIGSDAFYNCTNITVNKMPSSFTAIPEWCFGYCEKVNAGTFDYTGITTIGANSFAETKDTLGLRLPEGVVSIGNRAFYYIANVGKGASVYIPSTTTNIGNEAFYNPTSFDEPSTIYCYATVPPTIAQDSNGKYQKLLTYDARDTFIVVPKGCSAAYKAAPGWSDYADRITEAT